MIRKKLYQLSAVCSALLFVIMTVLPVQQAVAAGSAVFSAEGSGSVQTGSQVTAVVWVAPSGASYLNGSITISLVNLTFQGFNASGNFAGAAPVNGCSPGSTTCTLSIYNITSGISTKTSAGTLTINATGASGSTGQINLSGASADDSDGSPMAASGQSRTISITAPPSGGGGGGGGTGGTGGTGGASNPNPNATNPVSNPSPDNTVSFPDQNGQPQVVSENEYSVLLANSENSAGTETVATTTKKSSTGLIIKLGIGLSIVVLAAVAAKLLLARAARARELSRHVATGSSSTFVGGSADSGQTITPDDNKPNTPDNNPPSGPTIITPQQ